MLRFAFDYLSHRLRANTRHGTHSPFVYRLLDEVIYDERARMEYLDIERLRKALYQDHREITITDLGAGSQLNGSKRKKISTLARNALKPPRLAQLIYRLARASQAATAIELGTCLGITTAYLSRALEHGSVISVEGCPETSRIARGNLEKLGCTNIDLRTGNFDALFPAIAAAEPKLDFVFIDGNHRKQATIDYFDLCLAKVHEGSLLIFDDIYWSEGMKEAWQHIKSHPNVTITIDLFWIGLVFFKKGRSKEDFKIRF
ncbi:O-methyltransferase [Hufsiella ginkgonis]|uniref:SAM-dependent methyltransferase n=1 Tax=Hufsiella ginkgonis TaxID=2695274 RepID=A0A7K1Y3F0_9SPHI|nr:class I SAM-dependent methyltransferase [Hufsiella ginkgonis]MXV17638.1 SAM-dependent methyltransferase [Hufsiella ginkgonis]